MLYSIGKWPRSISLETGEEARLEGFSPIPGLPGSSPKQLRTHSTPYEQHPPPPAPLSPTYLLIFICWLPTAELASYVSCLLTPPFLRGLSLGRPGYMHILWAQHHASAELAETNNDGTDGEIGKDNLSDNSDKREEKGALVSTGSARA